MTHVALVHTDPAARRVITSYLHAHGCRVFTAEDAFQAAPAVLRARPDVLLVASRMPRYTGAELHETLELSSRTRHIPVIYLGSEESIADRLEAQALGARAFVPRPYDLAKLLQEILRVTPPPLTVGPAAVQNRAWAGSRGRLDSPLVTKYLL